MTPLFLPYSAYLRYLKYLCLLKVLEVLLVFEVYRWVSFLSSYHLGKFRYFWFLRSVEYFYRWVGFLSSYLAPWGKAGELPLQVLAGAGRRVTCEKLQLNLTIMI